MADVYLQKSLKYVYLCLLFAKINTYFRYIYLNVKKYNQYKKYEQFSQNLYVKNNALDFSPHNFFE